jgi:hypothetical protein
MPTAEGYRFAGLTGWGWGRIWHTNRGHQHGRRGRLEVAGDGPAGIKTPTPSRLQYHLRRRALLAS